MGRYKLYELGGLLHKKIFSCFLSALIGIGCIDFMHISAAESAPYARYSTGLIRETEEEIIEKTGCEVIDASDYHVRTTRSLPVSCDVTTGPKYFPPIDTQGDMASCTAWATTYYQFTYELNRYLGEQIIDGTKREFVLLHGLITMEMEDVMSD